MLLTQTESTKKKRRRYWEPFLDEDISTPPFTDFFFSVFGAGVINYVVFVKSALGGARTLSLTG